MQTAALTTEQEIDLFGEENESWEDISRAHRAKELEDVKGVKPVTKSIVILAVKPLDDETSMEEIESHVRSIEIEGLQWKTSQLVPVLRQINALQITCVVEDEVVSVDAVEELILERDDIVQSVDIVAFNKL